MSDDADSAGFSEPIDVSQEAVPSADGPRRSRRLARRTVVVTVIAVGVAAGGGAIAAAAGGHGGGAPNRDAGGYGAAGPEGGGMPRAPGGRPGTGDPMMRSIHGTFVAPSTTNGKTTYVTEVQQAGTVTALSSASISVTSADGYRATYVIGSTTKKDSAVTQGGQAVVVATGDPATALSVVVPGDRPGRGGMRGGPQGAPPSGTPMGRPTGAPGGTGV